ACFELAPEAPTQAIDSVAFSRFSRFSFGLYAFLIFSDACSGPVGAALTAEASVTALRPSLARRASVRRTVSFSVAAQGCDIVAVTTMALPRASARRPMGLGLDS